jgi:hypothetical protein
MRGRVSVLYMCLICFQPSDLEINGPERRRLFIFGLGCGVTWAVVLFGPVQCSLSCVRNLGARQYWFCFKNCCKLCRASNKNARQRFLFVGRFFFKMHGKGFFKKT